MCGIGKIKEVLPQTPFSYVIFLDRILNKQTLITTNPNFTCFLLFLLIYIFLQTHISYVYDSVA